MTDQSGGGQSGGQSQQGGGQQQSSAAPAGGMPIEQIDRAAPRQQPVRTENPNVSRGISPAGRSREEAAARQSGQQPGAEQQSDQQQPGSQPPAGGDEKIKFGDQELAVAELADLRKFKGEQDARKLTLPKDPNGYTLDLPADFKPPAGVKFEFNKSDPVLARARELAHSRGMDQSTFSDFLGVYAANRVAEANTINTARNAELARLGSAATDRITAIRTFLHGTIGSDLAGAIEQTLCTSKQVEAWEAVVNKFSRQGGTPFSQGHREQEPPKGTIPGYDKMTFEQRRAAQMSQNQPARTYREPNR